MGMIKSILFAFLLLLIGFTVPQNFVIPVDNTHNRHWDNESFWYWPWGKSLVHKGVDIFADEGTSVFASTNGIVLYSGQSNNGGNIIYILGPKWRVHYYAHLKALHTTAFTYVSCGEIIGKVGNTGNAIGKPPHLHYTIETYIPYFWRWDKDFLGWKKMFYLNPIDYMDENLKNSCSKNIAHEK